MPLFLTSLLDGNMYKLSICHSLHTLLVGNLTLEVRYYSTLPSLPRSREKAPQLTSPGITQSSQANISMALKKLFLGRHSWYFCSYSSSFCCYNKTLCCVKVVIHFYIGGYKIFYSPFLGVFFFEGLFCRAVIFTGTGSLFLDVFVFSTLFFDFALSLSLSLLFFFSFSFPFSFGFVSLAFLGEDSVFLGVDSTFFFFFGGCKTKGNC